MQTIPTPTLTAMTHGGRAASVKRPQGQGFGFSGRVIVPRPTGENSEMTPPGEIAVSIRAEFTDVRPNAEATR